MRRKILSVIGNAQALRRKSAPFPSFEKWDESEKSGVKDLIDTFNVIQGFGLAAPQIGIFKRAVVINPTALGIPDFEGIQALTMVNPQIKTSGEKKRSKEACFSVPHVDGFVERPQNCEVSFLDETGSKRTLSVQGYAAVCLQHEIDHLDGILYIDRMGSLSRSMTLKKMNKLEKKKRDAEREAKSAFMMDHLSIMGHENKKKKTGHSKKRKPKPRKQRPRRSKKR